MTDIEMFEEQQRQMPAVRQAEVAVAPEMSVDDLIAQMAKLDEAVARAMTVDVHYGVIPGTKKPTLLKAGAERLCVLFKLAPSYPIDQQILTHDNEGHFSAELTCVLTHIPTGLVHGQGLGSCTTREQRYAFRNQARLCPACGAEAIIKGKAEYGGGWLCFKRKDGCGAKFSDGDPVIETQAVGKIATPAVELPDLYNTVLKMAAKRSLIAAVLNATGASDKFTQDLEDMRDTAPHEPTVPPVDEVPVVRIKNWTEWMKLAEGIDEHGGWDFWLDECSVVKWDLTLKELPVATRKGEAFQRAAAGLSNLILAMEGRDFPPPSREEVSAAFRAGFQIDAALAGPPWSLSPEEDDKPSYDEWDASMNAPAVDDGIEFGEPAQDAPDLT